MQLNTLRVFQAVIKAGSFSGAAAALSVAQPLLSRQMRTLEEELDVELFYRNGRGVVLTDAGKIFETHVTTVIDALNLAAQELSATKASPTGEVVIGLPPTVGSFLTVPLVELFQQKFPQVSLGVVEGFSGFVLEWLANGRIDVAVLYNAPPTSSLVSDELDVEQLYLFGPRNSKAVPRNQVEIDGAAIAGVPLILPSRAHGLRILLDNIFRQRDLQLKVAYEVDSLSSIQNMVRAGLGHTILPYAPMHDLVESGKVCYWTICNPELKRRLVVATSGKRVSTLVTRELVKFVRQIVGRMRQERKLAPSPLLLDRVG